MTDVVQTATEDDNNDVYLITASAWKGISMIVFTSLSIIGFIVAILLKERAKQLYVSSGSMFSAGILLAAGLVHLSNDSNRSFLSLAENGLIPCSVDKCFPWSPAIAAFTIVLLVSIEMLVTDLILRKSDSDNNSNSNTNNNNNDIINNTEETTRIGKFQTRRSSCRFSTHGGDGNIIPGDDDEKNDNNNEDSVNSLAALVITIALGIHSIIEGIGVGATNNINDIRSSFIAIGIHKGFTAFALASSLVASGYWSDKSKRKYFYASTGLFIGLTLIGIAIGWGISTATSEDSLVSAILIACTAGSFLYVSAIEIIPEEMDIIKQQKLKTPLIILCFLMGYCLMTILAIWV